jgi:alcohol dehydrogenase class IV
VTVSAIYLPKILRIGAGASRQLVEVLNDLGVERPLLVTDPFMLECGYVEQITACLSAGKVECGVFADCVPDPTTDAIESAISYWHRGDFDSVVALGGGSSIDTAKALAVMAVHGGKMRDYKAPNTVPVGVPIIAIPTTAGTGSEATRVTVVTDTETQEKMMCLGLGLMPSAALIDFELTMTMPHRLTADTGIDSLCHAMEAFVSRKANAFTDSIALTSMASIAQYIRIACNDPDNREAREAMMLAATQGGMAFSNASVTLIHGMSRPLGAFFHVPHGLSNAMLMPVVTQFSLPGATARYAQCARAMGFALAGDNEVSSGIKLVDALYRLNEDLMVPSPKVFGIDQAEYGKVISIMAEQALASGSPNNNPLVPDQQQIEALYHQAWHSQ